MPVERDYSISWIRLLSTLLIIICHIFQFQNNDLCAWFNVGVPLFFIISGYLYGIKYRGGKIAFIKKNFKKILFPYWVFLWLAVVFYLFYPNCGVKPSIRSICFAFIGAGTLPGLRYLWFVPYILFCYILVPYLHSIKEYCNGKNNLKAIYIYACVVIALQVMGFAFKSFFLPDRLVAFVIAFFLPDIFSRISVSYKKFFIASLVVIGALAWLFRYYVRYVYSGPYTQIAGLYDRYSMVVAAIAIFISLKTLFKHATVSRFLTLSDRLSYHIYLVHGFFIFGPIAVLTLTPHVVLNLGVLFLLILLSAILLQRVNYLSKAFANGHKSNI